MKLLITFLLSSINIFAIAQQKKTDLQKENLKGKVKSLSEITYKLSKNNNILEKDTENPLEKKSIMYDDKGNKVEENIFDITSHQNVKWTYRYDKNLLVERKQTNDKQIFSIHGVLKYDNKNNKIEEDIFSDYGGMVIHHKYIFKYDKNNNLIEELLYIPNQDLVEMNCIYTYDNKNNIIETNRYNSKGLLIQKIKANYNENNKLISSHIYNEVDELDLKEIFLYDDKGNILNKETYHFNIPPPPPPMEMPIQTNNNHSNKEGYNNPSLKKETYQYIKYDTKGNWIERIIYSNEKINSITERIIEYYE